MSTEFQTSSEIRMTHFSIALHVAMLVVLFGCSKSDHAIPQNWLQVTPANVQLGDAWPSQEFSTQITLLNLHPTLPITILEVQTSCKCTVATLAKTRLLPGESITAVVFMAVGEALGEAVNTTAFKWQTDSQSETSSGIGTVRISADVVDLIRLPYRSISFDSIDKNNGIVQGSLSIHPGNSVHQIDSIVVQSSHPAFSAKCSRINGGGFELNYTLNPAQMPIGSFRESLELVFYDGQIERGRKEMQVLGTVRGAVRVEPPFVKFLSTPKNGRVSQLIRLYSSKGAKSITLNGEINPHNKHIEIAAEPSGSSGLTLKVSIQIPAASIANGQSDIISVPVLIDGLPEMIHIPVLVFVSP